MSKNKGQQYNTEPMSFTEEKVGIKVDNDDYPIEMSTFIGVVVNCVKLNVRKKPAIESDVVCVLDKSSEVIVNKHSSTDNFYKVSVNVHNKNLEGFCAKEFIEVTETGVLTVE